MEGICKINDEGWVIFYRDFNQELTPKIIQFLSKYQKVKFGWDFNQFIDKLPNCLTHLIFGDDFNQPIHEDSPTGKSSILPNGLISLNFGRKFNQPVTYQTESSQNGKSPTLLPNSLTHLAFTPLEIS